MGWWCIGSGSSKGSGSGSGSSCSSKVFEALKHYFLFLCCRQKHCLILHQVVQVNWDSMKMKFLQLLGR